MQRLHFRESTLVSASLLLAATLALGACSSSGGSGGNGNTQPATSPAAPTSSAPASGEPTSGAGAVSAIEKNWATFFNAKTSTSKRLALLQDGDKLAAVIKSQSTNPLAATASAKVSHVALTGTDQASVTYKILVSGQAVLSGQQGTAVYQDGVWKVGLASFCALLKLENAGKSSGLPPACKG
jgi:coat protein